MPKSPDAAPKLFLGIDPGLADCGYAVVASSAGGTKLSLVEAGSWKTKKAMPLADRLAFIGNAARELIAKHPLERAGIEKLYFQKNVTSAMAVAQARGVALQAIAEAGLAYVEFTPTAVKSALTGFGSADKRQVALTAKMLLGLKELPKPDDATDAIAMAIAAAWHQPALHGNTSS